MSYVNKYMPFVYIEGMYELSQVALIFLDFDELTLKSVCINPSKENMEGLNRESIKMCRSTDLIRREDYAYTKYQILFKFTDQHDRYQINEYAMIESLEKSGDLS